jgi:hypothetical protein
MSITQKLETVPANQAPIDPADILTPEELAERFKVPVSWIFEQTRQRAITRSEGKPPLPCHPLGKKTLRFYWPEVSQWWLLQNKD